MPRILPKKSEIPSESTIETLTNHFIMQSLSHLSAWIFCPTRYQENSWGYDGAIRNTKFAVIQYKRITVNVNSLSIKIDKDQLSILKNNFKRTSKPMAFYCFSFLKEIKDIELTFDSTFSRFNPSFYGSIFFNALDLPLYCSSVRWTYCKVCYPAHCRKNSLEFYEGIYGRYTSIDYWTGPAFVTQFEACSLGCRISELENVEIQERNDNERSLRLNYLIGKVM